MLSILYNMWCSDMGKSKLILLLAVLCLTQTATADRTTCPDGTVQYTPCSEAQLNAKPKYTTPRRVRPVKYSTPAGKVLHKKFVRLSTVKGLWQGFVASIGTTHLKLVFLKNGTVVETRYIGSVTRKSHERPTKFKFISSIPRDAGLSWQIVAQTV